VNHRLYEQGTDLERIGTYIRHWLRWLNVSVMVNPSFSYCSICHVDLVSYHDPPVTGRLVSSIRPSNRYSGYLNHNHLHVCYSLTCTFARRARVSLVYLSDCEVSDMLIAYSTYRCGLCYSGNSVAEAGR